MPAIACKIPSITTTPRTHRTSNGRFFNILSGSKYPTSPMIAKNPKSYLIAGKIDA